MSHSPIHTDGRSYHAGCQPDHQREAYHTYTFIHRWQREQVGFKSHMDIWTSNHIHVQCGHHNFTLTTQLIHSLQQFPPLPQFPASVVKFLELLPF